MPTKKIAKGGAYYININSRSKDMVYVLKNSSLASSVTFNFVRAEGYETYSGYYKSGNNLVIATVYGEKLITNTIKDYFLYNPNYTSSLTTPDLVKVENSSINPDDVRTSYASGLFFDANNETDSILGSKGSDTYLISRTLGSHAKLNLNDFGGNDNYDIKTSCDQYAFFKLTDYTGNDYYQISNYTNIILEDKKGNDIYKANGVKKVNITDDSGNDKYTILDSADRNISIKDSKGKDTYEINASGDDDSTIIDKAGNDKYLLSNGAIIKRIEDTSGNDSYEYFNTSNIANDWTHVYDYAGNDKYNFSSVKQIDITDKKGNDKYNFYDLNMSATYESVVREDAGNDNYTANRSEKLFIYDKTGNDKYNISNSTKLNIEDGEEGSKKGGNDTYNLNNVQQNVNLNTGVNNQNITDYAGKDSYNITNDSKICIKDKNTDKKTSADKYSISVNSQALIMDEAGNDTYKINTSATNITDKLGNDKYTIVDGNNFYKDGIPANSVITDKAGNDNYKISNSKVDELIDNAGKDTYTISSNSDVKITDESISNDTYKINGMSSTVTINDEGGTKDKLTLSGVNKNNLVFMVDYSDDSDCYTGAVYSGNLIIFDKTNNGFVEIKDYFSMESSYLRYTNDKRTKITTETGCIEAIYAGKSNITNNMYKQLSGANVDTISADVAGWLQGTGHQYDSVSRLLESGDSTNIANFIATFANQNP